MKQKLISLIFATFMLISALSLTSCDSIKEIWGSLYKDTQVTDSEFRRAANGELFENVTISTTRTTIYPDGSQVTDDFCELKLDGNEALCLIMDSTVYSAITDNGDVVGFMYSDEWGWIQCTEEYSTSCLKSRKEALDVFGDYLDLPFDYFTYDSVKGCYYLEYDEELLATAYDMDVSIWFEGGYLLKIEAVDLSDDSDYVITMEFYDYNTTVVENPTK